MLLQQLQQISSPGKACNQSQEGDKLILAELSETGQVLGHFLLGTFPDWDPPPKTRGGDSQESSIPGESFLI